MTTHSILQIPTQSDAVPGFLRDLFGIAVRSAAPDHYLARHLPAPPKGKTFVVAIGKAAASMALAVEQAWPDHAPLTGIALTRYGHGCACARIEVVEASHPVPDDRGYEYAVKIAEQVEQLTKDDLLLFLVSGGGSALMTLPAEGISLSEKKRINKALLMSGAPIGEMNVVRKHVSALKGGRLAALARPAKIVSLAISDVPGDDPSTIASGPTVPDNSTRQQARDLLTRYEIETGRDIAAHLNSEKSETPKPGDAAFEGTEFKLVMKPADMLASVAAELEPLPIITRNLGADIEGEARLVAAEHADLALTLKGTVDLILSGGETSVTVDQAVKPGRGGRNCEYLLSLAIELNGADGVFALAADTDGIDGSETNAGAIITPDTLARGQELGMDARDFLAHHDSFTFFEKLGDLITTGPTRTNVNDFRAIWMVR